MSGTLVQVRIRTFPHPIDVPLYDPLTICGRSSSPRFGPYGRLLAQQGANDSGGLMPVMSNKTLVAVIAFVLLSGTLAHAQTNQILQSNSNTPTKTFFTQLVVLSTTVDRVNDRLTIRGIGFGSRAPQVYCETSPMVVLSATDTKLVVRLSDTMADGTYL